MANLKSASQIIDELGGTAAVSALTGRPQAQISRWRKWNKFPPQCYLIMTAALAVRGHYAAPSLWGQDYYRGAA